MRTLIWSNTFVRSFKRTVKKYPALRPQLEKILRMLAEDCFAPQLATHKLKGNLSGLWACKVDYELRIVFEFVEGHIGEDDIFLLDVGTHDEVY